MKTNDLKKGDMVIVKAFGEKVRARIEDNRKGNARSCFVFGSSIGLFDEHGSVYGHDILCKIEGRKKIKIEYTELQKNWVKNNSLWNDEQRIPEDLKAIKDIVRYWV